MLEWIEVYELDAVVVASRELALDTAENKLMEAVQEGKTAELLFFLKTQGKSRGYVERQEVENSCGQKVTVEVKITEDDLRSDSVE